MKHLYHILGIILLIAVKANAAYQPNMISSMVSPNSTIVCSVSNGVCSTDVATTKRNQWDTAYNYTDKWYNSSGRIYQPIKHWIGSVSPNDATDYSINISSAGFSTIVSVNIEVEQSQATWCVLESVSTTAVVVDLYQPNASLINILGNLVLLGVPTQVATNFTGLDLHVHVTGY